MNRKAAPEAKVAETPAKKKKRAAVVVEKAPPVVQLARVEVPFALAELVTQDQHKRKDEGPREYPDLAVCAVENIGQTRERRYYVGGPVEAVEKFAEDQGLGGDDD